MKKLLSILKKMFLVLFIIVLIGSSVFFGVMFFLKSRELDNLNSLYSEVQKNLNKDKIESEATIADLKQSFIDLNLQVDSLKSENADLKKQLSDYKKTERGKIEGSIVAFVSIAQEERFSQFQLICAENINNKNIKYCVSISALEKNFILEVPFGDYYVSSTIIAQDGSYTSKKAYYTEYVRCLEQLRNTNTNECDSSLSKKLVVLNVNSDNKNVIANPIDLQI